MKDTKTNNQNNTKHFPVLLDAVLNYLQPQHGESYLDLTAGYGGHAEAVLERTLEPSTTTLVDRDQHAITALRAQQQFTGAEIITRFAPAVIWAIPLALSVNLPVHSKTTSIIKSFH